MEEIDDATVIYMLRILIYVINLERMDRYASNTQIRHKFGIKPRMMAGCNIRNGQVAFSTFVTYFPSSVLTYPATKNIDRD